METWIAVPAFEGLYEVSDTGHIRSLITDRTLAAYICGKYPTVGLHRNGKRTPKAVHLAVLEAFVSPRPSGLVAAHLDGNVLNSALANLAWVTPSQNEAHKVAHGTSNHGRRSTQAKLSDQQVAIVREANALGLSMPKLAALAGVNTSTIHKIIQGKRYNH